MNDRDRHFASADDDDDTKLLVQKAWCHGQSIAPPILGTLMVLLFSRSWIESAMILAIVIAWPVVSWRSMQHPSANSFRRILMGGAVLLSLYVYLLGTMISNPGDTSAGVRILLMVFLSLMIVETMAYLAVVGYHRAWFERGPARNGPEGEALQG